MGLGLRMVVRLMYGVWLVDMLIVSARSPYEEDSL